VYERERSREVPKSRRDPGNDYWFSVKKENKTVRKGGMLGEGEEECARRRGTSFLHGGHEPDEKDHQCCGQNGGNLGKCRSNKVGKRRRGGAIKRMFENESAFLLAG